MSSETKWTPGPWRVVDHEGALSIWSDHGIITSGAMWKGRGDDGANAALIAAAPDLHQSNTRVTAWLRLICDSLGVDEDTAITLTINGEKQRHTLGEVLAASDAALAKSNPSPQEPSADLLKTQE